MLMDSLKRAIHPRQLLNGARDHLVIHMWPLVLVPTETPADRGTIHVGVATKAVRAVAADSDLSRAALRLALRPAAPRRSSSQTSAPRTAGRFPLTSTSTRSSRVSVLTV